MVRRARNAGGSAADEEARELARLAREMDLDPSDDAAWEFLKGEREMDKNFEREMKRLELQQKDLERKIRQNEQALLDMEMDQLEIKLAPEQKKELRRKLEQAREQDRKRLECKMASEREDSAFLAAWSKEMPELSAAEKKIPLTCPFCSAEIGETGVLTGSEDVDGIEFCKHCGGIFTTRDALPPKAELEKYEQEWTCPYCFRKHRVPFLRDNWLEVVCPRCHRTYPFDPLHYDKIPLGPRWNRFWQVFSFITQCLGILLLLAFPVLLITGIFVGVLAGEKGASFKFSGMGLSLVLSSVGALILSCPLLLLSLGTRPFFTRTDREGELYGEGIVFATETASDVFSTLCRAFCRFFEIIFGVIFAVILSNAIFGRRR